MTADPSVPIFWRKRFPSQLGGFVENQVRYTLQWLLRTVLLCLIVGLVLSFFNINPVRIFTHGWDTIRDIGDFVVGLFSWAIPYILLGAVVVVPIALIGLATRLMRR